MYECKYVAVFVCVVPVVCCVKQKTIKGEKKKGFSGGGQRNRSGVMTKSAGLHSLDSNQHLKANTHKQYVE